MIEKIKQLRGEVESFNASTLREVEDFRIKMLSKKGLISDLFNDFKTLAPDQKREVGQQL
ncbi:MAG: phenylalanine--tRNA ligase subunit alpha, partial [Bacteroidota bacterium]